MTFFAALVAIIVLVVSFRMAGAPDHDPRSAQLEQSFPGLTPSQLAAEGLTTGGGGLRDRPVRVNVRLEEGEFILKPGPPGSGVRVEGDYDAGVYDLKQDLTRDDDGTPVYTLSFRPRYTMLSRILRQGFVHIEHGTNRMTVTLPRDLPMALNVRVSKGESHIELGGLALTAASLDMSMGDHNVSAGEPNPLEMEQFEIRGAMGEVSLTELGNLRSGKITAWGKMGEFHLDMGERIERDTTLTANMRMGELTLGLPVNARLEIHKRIFLGDSEDTPTQDGPADPNNAFALTVDAGTTLGDLTFSTR